MRRDFAGSSGCFFRRTPAVYRKCVRPPCLIYCLSTSGEVFFLPAREKCLFIPMGVQASIPFLFARVVCTCLSAAFGIVVDCESCTRSISTNAGSMEAGGYGLLTSAWDVSSLTPRGGGRGCRSSVVSVVCFGCGGIACFLFFFFSFSSSAHGLLHA